MSPYLSLIMWALSVFALVAAYVRARSRGGSSYLMINLGPFLILVAGFFVAFVFNLTGVFLAVHQPSDFATVGLILNLFMLFAYCTVILNYLQKL